MVDWQQQQQEQANLACSRQLHIATKQYRAKQTKCQESTRTVQSKADKVSRVPEDICPVHIQHDIWLVLLEGAVHLVQQPLVAANVGC